MERKERSVEARGRTVDEAIEQGLAELGLRREDVEIEVITRGSRGVLGLGAEEARVLLTPARKAAPAPKAAAPQPAPRVTPPPAPRVTPPPIKMPEKTVEEPPRPREEPKEAPQGEAGDLYDEMDEGQGEAGDLSAAALGEIQRAAGDALSGLLKHMSIPARVVAKTPTGYMVEGNNPPPILLDIEGEDLGVLIGRRGETLSALQYLVRLMVNRQTRRWVNVVIDVEGYKERRERQLKQLAERMAERVVATQKPVVLEAMPPYERRIIHMALREHPTVTTHSIGEGDSRKVMLVLK